MEPVLEPPKSSFLAPGALPAATADHESAEVPTRTRFVWGLGGFSDAMIVYGTGSMVNVIYVNALAMNPALANLACAIPRFMDFVTDPVIGYLSDNTRSRWGRRKPWIFVGLIISAIMGVLLWRPPHSSGRYDWAAFAFLCVMMSLLYSVGYAFFNIPHVAMGYEMTTDYDERTHLFKWRFYAFAAAGFLTPWLIPAALWLEGNKAQTLKGSQGVVYISIIGGILVLVTGLPTVFFCREKIEKHTGEPKVKFLRAVKLTLNNRPFWLLVISNFITKFGMSLTGIFFFYVFVYHIAKGQQSAGAAYLAIFFNAINISNFLAMEPVARSCDRFGKKPTLLFMLAMSALAYASLWYTFTNGDSSFYRIHVPRVGSFSLQWPSLVTAILIGVFTNTMPLVKNSMLADVCDLDELNCGHRREAFYGAVFLTTDKIAIAASTAFQGVLLLVSGFNAKQDIQSWSTIRFWLLALVLTQPFGYVIGISSIFAYPLSRQRVHEIRAQLDARQALRVDA